MHNNQSLNWYVETSYAILHIALPLMIRLFSVNSRRKTFNAIPSRWRKSKRENQASVLLRPREKSRVYRVGTCERKKRREATDRMHQRRTPRPREPIVPQGHSHGVLAIISSPLNSESSFYLHYVPEVMVKEVSKPSTIPN